MTRTMLGRCKPAPLCPPRLIFFFCVILVLSIDFSSLFFSFSVLFFGPSGGGGSLRGGWPLRPSRLASYAAKEKKMAKDKQKSKKKKAKKSSGSDLVFEWPLNGRCNSLAFSFSMVRNDRNTQRSAASLIPIVGQSTIRQRSEIDQVSIQSAARVHQSVLVRVLAHSLGSLVVQYNRHNRKEANKKPKRKPTSSKQKLIETLGI